MAMIEGVGGRDADAQRPPERKRPDVSGRKSDPEPDVRMGVEPVSDPVSEPVSEAMPDDEEEIDLD